MMDGGVNPSTVCLDVAKRKCDFFIRCKADQDEFTTTARPNDSVAPGERAKCEALFANERACNVGAAGWTAGRAILDPVKYAACVDAAYPANSCARDLNDVATKCAAAQFVTAATAPGGNCTSDGECIKGWCNIPGNNAICGTCQTWLNADAGTQNCQRDSQCDPSRSFCFGSDTTPQNQPCRSYTNPDAGCVFASTNQEECGPNHVCAATGPGMFNPPSACLTGKLENAPCTKGRWECFRSGRGRYDLVCATDSQGFDTCQKQFNAVAGGRCGTGETAPGFNGALQGTFCLESEFCAAGICATRRAANIACNSTDQCQSGLRCANVNGSSVCTPFADVDGGCAQSATCKNMLNCTQGGTCQAGYSLDGGACSGTILCAEGFCGQTAVPTCAPLQPNGAACSKFSECSSYSCGPNNTCAMACWKP